jgi:hypothetical protein
MSKSKQHSFSSVISVNPYSGTYITGVSSFLNETKSPAYSKDQFAISYLNTKEFINAQIEISKNIPDEDIYDAINSKAYDELALDNAVEYQIQYIETFNNLDEENRHFHVFIVDPLEINQTYANVVETIKYIDITIPVPLLLKSLYSKEIVDSNGVHCYIYIQENDAFITIYGNKEFIYTKSIKYSLIDMHERFCELYGERIDYNEFVNFYSNVSLKKTDSEYKEYFIKLYKELFANANDILTYAKRAFEIEKFEHVYIGSQVDTVTKLDEMIEVELNLKASEFDFDYGYESADLYVDQLHSLMQIYTTVSQDEKYECNFSLNHRPPTFLKRESGKIIMVALASLIIAFAYPVTYWILSYAQGVQKDLLQQEYKEVHNVKVTRESTIKSKQADKVKSIALLNIEKEEYLNKKQTLIKIHEVKVNYPMKAKLLAALTKDLNKFNVKIESVSYQESETAKTFTLNLVSSKNRKITKLVEYLTKTHQNKFNFKLQDILYDDESHVYFSQLKVDVL